MLFLSIFDFPFYFCSAAVLIGAITNIFLQFYIKENQLNNFSSTFFLFYDLLQLAVLLYLTGGITNPFTILLIIPAIVSSTFLTLRSTVNLSIITILALVIITIDYQPLPHTGDLHFHVPKYYLYGIPTAVIVGLVFLTYFGARFGSESRKRTEALNKLELILAKEHELESIGERAAAAAHSLGTPLSTIAVISKELQKEIGDNPKYSKDVNLLILNLRSDSMSIIKVDNIKMYKCIFIFSGIKKFRFLD